MNPSRFDDLTRSVALSTSRRHALKFLTASLVGGFLLRSSRTFGENRSSTPNLPAATSAGGVVRFLGASASSDPDIGANTFELLSYESGGYRFRTISLGATPPTGFEQPDFDDSEFTEGIAPFGGGVDVGCPLDKTVQTLWPIGSELLVRHTFFIPEGVASIRIMVSLDNDLIAAFVNGQLLIQEPIVHEGCASLDRYRIDIPASVVQPGDNFLAFHVRDRGVQSFFDIRILAELSSAVLGQTLDQTAQAISAALLGIPNEPVSNVTTNCSSSNSGKTMTINFFIPRTGESGNLHIEASTRDHSTQSYYVNGQLLTRTSITWGDEGRDLNLSIRNSPNVATRQTNTIGPSDPAMNAMSNVLTMPSVSYAIEACLHAVAPNPGIDCAANCRAISKDGHNRIDTSGKNICRGAVLGGGALTGMLAGASLGARGGVGGIVAGGLLGLAVCWIEDISNDRKKHCWDVWEEQCLGCCEDDCPVDVCTSNQPRTLRGSGPCTAPMPYTSPGMC
jgi:hypothetical protein